MNSVSLFRRLVFAAAAVATVAVSAQGLDPALQAKLDAKAKEVAGWAADPVLVEAARKQNAAPPADYAAMTKEKWKGLTVLDPLVRGLAKNPVGAFLKTKQGDLLTEAFASDAKGAKLGFIAKTSNWSHAGAPKHEVPMTGKVWFGAVEVDESTGKQQIQLAVPILDGGKPIGSLVVGVSIAGLKS